MMLIRNSQMAVFRREAEQRFESGMMSCLAEVLPQRAGDPALRAVVRAGIAKARGHGIEDARSVAQLIGLMVKLGADFDERADYRWARAIFRDDAIDSDVRLDTVVEALAGRVTDETPAAAQGDDE